MMILKTKNLSKRNPNGIGKYFKTLGNSKTCRFHTSMEKYLEYPSNHA